MSDLHRWCLRGMMVICLASPAGAEEDCTAEPPYCERPENICDPQCRAGLSVEAACAETGGNWCRICDPRCKCEYEPCASECAALCPDLPGCHTCNPDCPTYDHCACYPCEESCAGESGSELHCDPQVCAENVCRPACQSFAGYCDPGHCPANSCDPGLCPGGDPCAQACGGSCAAHCATPPEDLCQCAPCACQPCGNPDGPSGEGGPWGGVGGSGHPGNPGDGGAGWGGYGQSGGSPAGPCQQSPGSAACCTAEPCHSSCGCTTCIASGGSWCQCAPGSTACCENEPCDPSCLLLGTMYLGACCAGQPCHTACEQLNGPAGAAPAAPEFGPCGQRCADPAARCDADCTGTVAYQPCDPECIALNGPCPCELDPCSGVDGPADPCACNPCHPQCPQRDVCACDGAAADCCDPCAGADPCNAACISAEYAGDADFYTQVCGPLEAILCAADPCGPDCAALNPCACDPTGPGCCAVFGLSACSAACGGCANPFCIDDTPCDGPCGGLCSADCHDAGPGAGYQPCVCEPGSPACCGPQGQNPCDDSCGSNNPYCCEDPAHPEHRCLALCDSTPGDGNLCNDADCLDYLYTLYGSDPCNPQNPCGTVCGFGCPLADDPCVCGTAEECCAKSAGICECNPSPGNVECCGDASGQLGSNPCFYGCDSNPPDPRGNPPIYDLCDEPNCRAWLEQQVEINPEWCLAATCDFVQQLPSCRQDGGSALAVDPAPAQAASAPPAFPAGDPTLELSAPYRGPDDAWREACLLMPYGEIANIALPCDLTGPLHAGDPDSLPRFACAELTASGPVPHCDRSVIRFFAGQDAAGDEIRPQPGEPFTNVPVAPWSGSGPTEQLRFSAKAIGIRSEAPRKFRVTVTTTENGPASASHTFTVTPTQLPATAEFLPAAPLLQVSAGRAELTVAAGTPREEIGQAYCYLKFTDHRRNSTFDPAADAVALAAQLPGTWTGELVNLPHVSQFPSEDRKGVPWPGHVPFGWRFDYECETEEGVAVPDCTAPGALRPARPMVIDPEGNVFLYHRRAGDQWWALSEIVPFNAVHAGQHITLGERPSNLAHHRLFEIADAAAGTAIRVYTPCWTPAPGASAGDALFETIIDITSNGVVERRWRLPAGGPFVTALIPVDPQSGADLPGARRFVNPSGVLAEVRDAAGDTVLARYERDSLGRILNEYRQVDGALALVRQHVYEEAQTTTHEQPLPGAEHRVVQVLSYGADEGAAAGDYLTAIHLDGVATTYDWAVEHPQGTVGLTRIVPPAPSPETRFQYVLYDQDDAARYLPLIQRSYLRERGCTQPCAELDLASVQWNLNIQGPANTTAPLDWMLPHVLERRDPAGAVMRYEYQPVTTYHEHGHTAQRLLLTAVEGPQPLSGPQPPAAYRAEYMHLEAADQHPAGEHLPRRRRVYTDESASGLSERLEHYDYDAAGRLTAITVAPEALDLTTRIERFTCDNQPELIRDPRGYYTRHFYGAGGLLQGTRRYADHGVSGPQPGPSGADDIHYVYAADGWAWYMDEISDSGPARRTVYERDAAGHVIRVRRGAAAEEPGGLLPPVLAERYHFDHLGRVIKQTAADGTFERYAYDARGQLSRVSAGHGATLTLGEQASISDPDYPTGALYGIELGPDGAQTTRYDYRPDGLLQAVWPADGIATTYEYDSLGRLASAMRAGAATTYQYDAAGRLDEIRSTGPSGPGGSPVLLSAMETLYNEAGWPYQIIRRAGDGSAPEDAISVLLYHQDGGLRRIIEKNPRPDLPLDLDSGEPQPGDRFEDYVYDAAGRLTAVSAPWRIDQGKAQTCTAALELDPGGAILTATLSAGAGPKAASGEMRTHSFAYDFLGRRIEATHPTGASVQTDYGSASWLGPQRVIRRDTAARGAAPMAQQHYEYDALGRLSAVYAISSPALVFDPQQPPDPGLHPRHAVFYDEAGRVQRMTYPQNREVLFSYDEAARSAAIIAPAQPPASSDAGLTGTTTTLWLDPHGRLEGLERREFVSDTGLPPADLAGPPPITPPPGGPFAGRGVAGQTIGGTPPGAVLTRRLQFGYDSQGFVGSLQRSGVFNNASNHAGRDPAAAAGANPAAPTGPEALETVFTRNGAGAAVAILNPRGVAASRTLDALGQVRGIGEDAGGPDERHTHFVLDRLGRMVELHAPGGDAAPQVTRFEYDPAGRATRLTWPDGAVQTTAYDVFGDPDHSVDARGVEIVHDVQFTAEGRRITRTASDGSRRVYQFDALERLAWAETYAPGMAGPVTRVQRSHDALNRLFHEEQTLHDDVQQVLYSYNLAGTPSTLIYPDGSVLEYAEYDACGRPVRLTLDQHTLAELTYTGDRLTRRSLYHANGDEVLRLNIAYDVHGRRTAMAWSGAGGEQLDVFACVYDPAGNPVTLGGALPEDTWNLAYDHFDRLRFAEQAVAGVGAGRPAVATAYAWEVLDPAGNWSNHSITTGPAVHAESRTHDQANALTAITAPADAAATFVYDRAGNLLAGGGSGAPKQYYRYDAWNQLVEVRDLGDAQIDADGQVISGSLGEVKAAYVYDALGRRVLEQRPAGDGEMAATRFLYDGWRVLEERAAAPGSEQAPTVRRYYWGTEYIDELWAMDASGVRGSMRRYYVTHDQRFSVRSLFWYQPGPTYQPAANAGGSAAPSPGLRRAVVYDYSPYGQRSSRVHLAAVDGPIGFQGLRHDPDTALIHVRHRYLDPALGRWTQRDPLGYAGSTNLYEAFASNPMRFVDPMGTEVHGLAETKVLPLAGGRQFLAAHYYVHLDGFSKGIVGGIFDYSGTHEHYLGTEYFDWTVEPRQRQRILNLIESQRRLIERRVEDSADIAAQELALRVGVSGAVAAPVAMGVGPVAVRALTSAGLGESALITQVAAGAISGGASLAVGEMAGESLVSQDLHRILAAGRGGLLYGVPFGAAGELLARGRAALQRSRGLWSRPISPRVMLRRLRPDNPMSPAGPPWVDAPATNGALKQSAGSKGPIGPRRVVPFEVRYSQPTVSQRFRNGRSLQETLDALNAGTLSPADLPPIRVVQHDGMLWTLDHRRLVVLRAAGIESIQVQQLSLTDPEVVVDFILKFNPIDQGTMIVITPNAAGRKAAEELLRAYGKIR